MAVDAEVLMAKVQTIEKCIETVKARIATAKACGYNESYIAGMEDILVFHEASLERVRSGENFHPTSELMSWAAQVTAKLTER